MSIDPQSWACSSLKLAVAFTALLATLVLIVESASGQIVRVERADGSRSFGHGYVFGDRTTGACKIAIPAHVVRTTSNQLISASLVGLDGKGGTALDFQQPDQTVDLAFGHVEGLGGQCLSRLPAQSVSESIAAGTTARLTVSDTATGGVRTMPVRIRDKGLTGHFSIEAVSTAAEPNPRILPGYSGSMVDLVGGGALGGRDLPLGLVVSVCDGTELAALAPGDVFSDNVAVSTCGDGEYARVVDFDLIKELAELADEKQSARTESRPNWKLVDYRASVVSGTAASLADGDDCFVATPQPEQSNIELTVSFPGKDSLSGLTLDLCDQPGGPLEISIGAGELSYRSLATETQTTDISLGARPATDTWIRLKPTTDDKSVGIREMTFHTSH